MKSNGKSKKQILLMCSIVVAAVSVASAIGYSLFSKAGPDVISVAISFSACAVLVMLAESMIPESFSELGSKIGLAATAGFAIAFIRGKQ